MAEKNIVDWIAFVLVIIGGINWGLVALKFDLVAFLFSSIPVLQTTVYALVGVAALYMVYFLMKE